MASAATKEKRKKRRAKIKQGLKKFGKGLGKVVKAATKVGLQVGGAMFGGPMGAKLGGKIGGVLDKFGKGGKGGKAGGKVLGFIKNLGKRKKSKDAANSEVGDVVDSAMEPADGGGLIGKLKLGANNVFKRLKGGGTTEIDDLSATVGDGSPLMQELQPFEPNENTGVSNTELKREKLNVHGEPTGFMEWIKANAALVGGGLLALIAGLFFIFKKK